MRAAFQSTVTRWPPLFPFFLQGGTESRKDPRSLHSITPFGRETIDLQPCSREASTSDSVVDPQIALAAVLTLRYPSVDPFGVARVSTVLA